MASGTPQPNALVDNNGIVGQHFVYDSFGNRLSEVDRNAAGTIIASTHAAVDTIFGYTGGETHIRILGHLPDDCFLPSRVLGLSKVLRLGGTAK